MPGGSAWKTNVGKAAWELRGKLIWEKVAVEVHGQMMLEKVTVEVFGKLMLEKVPGEVNGKLMLEKMPGEVRGKIMLEKVPGKLLRKLNVGKSAWRARLQTAGRVIDKVFRGHNVTSLKLKRRQCRLQLFYIFHYTFHQIHHTLSRILMNCRNLCALAHVGKMSRFTHFTRHKILAARHF